MSEAEWVQMRVYEAKEELRDVVGRLMADLPAGYIVTDCSVLIGRVDLTGGGSRVFIDDVQITVEVVTPTVPPTKAPSTPAP